MGNDTTQQTQRTFARANLLQNCSGFLRTCYGEVANLLQTFYEETGVMDFGLDCAETVSVVSCNYRLLFLLHRLSCLTNQREQENFVHNHPLEFVIYYRQIIEFIVYIRPIDVFLLLLLRVCSMFFLSTAVAGEKKCMWEGAIGVRKRGHLPPPTPKNEKKLSSIYERFSRPNGEWLFTADVTFIYISIENGLGHSNTLIKY